ncbi:MAG: DUF1289 domain-containing protein [Alphaproteobacteria bacterium]|nr:DUF1289 domain-containing protein [Alphaproteobacteria bacterium]
MTSHAERTSPCLKICRLAPGARICEGCGRSLREIGGWSAMSDGEREAVLRELPSRLARLRAPGG